MEFAYYRFNVIYQNHVKDLICIDDNKDDCEIGATATPSGGGVVSGDVTGLAKQMLANPKITYWTNNGVNTRDIVVALSEGRPAPVTCSNTTIKTAEVNPNILKFLIEAGQQTNVMVNAISDKCHSSTSKHYIGAAVDLDLQSGPLNIINPIAAKYGGAKNNETTHHHFDFPKQ